MHVKTGRARHVLVGNGHVYIALIKKGDGVPLV
jgi:hypothetical protein